MKFQLQAGRTPKPIVKIDGLPTQDSCAEHTIFDARRSAGNLGREFASADWIFLGAPAAVKMTTWTRVQNQLKDSFDGAMLQAEIICQHDDTKESDEALPGNEILCSSLTAGKYTVGLNVTNWITGSGSATFSWNRVNIAAGNVRIVGDANQVFSSFASELHRITHSCCLMLSQHPLAHMTPSHLDF